MTQEPTGVFVRLPLSEEQIIKLYNPKQSWNENLLSIGTPVTGAELEAAGWCHPEQLANLHIDNDSPDNERFVVMSRVKIGSRDVPLVRQSEAQAQLAARDAEIVRLLGIVNTLSSKISECGSEGYDLSGADCVDLLNDAGLIEWGTFDPEVHESSMFDGCEPGDPIWTLKGGAA